jgi:hypothetical protein
MNLGLLRKARTLTQAPLASARVPAAMKQIGIVNMFAPKRSTTPASVAPG